MLKRALPITLHCARGCCHNTALFMSLSRKIRVLHFVNGNLRSGATHVAIHLVKAALNSATVAPLLVLRCRRKDNPEQTVAELEAAGVPVQIVPRGRLQAVYALVRICRTFQPDMLLAHGFSDHLWGRYAGLLAEVPHLIQVEHNTREPYNAWSRLQSRWLAKHSARIIGVSEGVREVLLKMGMPEQRTMAIPNGIDLTAFTQAEAHSLAERIPGIVMTARLHKQKDHAGLLRAVALLHQRGLTPLVLLVGSGSASKEDELKQLSTQLGLHDQIQFLGQRQDVPELLMTHRICVLISHWEGYPLALAEGMAAGCAVVASDIPGMRELITAGENGLLVPPNNPEALADALEHLLRDEDFATRLGAAARQTAVMHYGRDLMNARYEQLFVELASPTL